MRGVAGLTALVLVVAPRLAQAQSLKWSDLSPVGPPPSDRRSCPAATVPGASDRVYVFGGFGSGSGNNISTRFREDLWYYDSGDANWHLSPATSNRPTLRDRHAMAYDPVAQRIVVFGGYVQSGPVINPTETFLDDVHVYDPATDQWSNPVVSMIRPTARRDARMHWSPELGALLLFGGEDATSRLNQLWTLTIDTGANTATWNPLTPSGTAPSPRNAPCTAYDTSNGRLIVFGGEVSTSVMADDTIAYDAATNAWLSQSVSGQPPPARAYCAADYDPQLGLMVLHGGQSGTDVVDGTFTYDPATQTWTSLTLSPTPGAREVGGMAYSADLGGILNFGGRVGTVTYANDTWLFEPTPCTPSAPTDTTCDGTDDDCDGSTDDEYQAAATVCGEGPCSSAGTTSCVSGSVVDSCVPGTPLASTDATCNGVDDDCDGGADEEFIPAATTCGSGLCQRAGALVCVAGAATDTCVPGTPLFGLFCCEHSDCDDGDACTADTCSLAGTCAHTQGACSPPPPDPCEGVSGPCQSGTLSIARGAVTPVRAPRLDATERPVLQLVLDNGPVGARVQALQTALRLDAPELVTVAWRLYDDADGDGLQAASAAPLAEGTGTGIATVSIDLPPDATRTLLLTVRRLPATADARWMSVLAGALLIVASRRRGRAVLLSLILAGMVQLEACGRSGFERRAGTLVLQDITVEPLSGSATDHVVVVGLPIDSAAFEL